MATVITQAAFFNLATGSGTSGTPIAVATAGFTGDGDLVDVQITKKLDAPWHVHFGLLASGTACAVVVGCTGGSDGQGTVTPLLCQLSLDGGASCDVRLIITSAQRVLDPARPMLVIDQDDLY